MPSGRYQTRLRRITSERGAGAAMVVPWTSNSANIDWLPVLRNCRPARSPALNARVWSSRPCSVLSSPVPICSAACQGVRLSAPVAPAASSKAICSWVDRYERTPRYPPTWSSSASVRSCLSPY
ncbi:Uncharacterised protein [Bordetella pertussis]|nr:Uncharacterised protein [Bordetella pertussis]